MTTGIGNTKWLTAKDNPYFAANAVNRLLGHLFGSAFANPVGEGQRIVSIPPMKRVALKTQVSVGREHVQQYDVGGKKVCVPLLALNALYKWSSGSEGQTSASYLLGRDTQGEKLAPFRLDLGPRLFRAVGARLLPSGLRT